MQSEIFTWKKTIADFIGQHLDKLVKHAYFRLGRMEDAEDLVQDVLVKIITGEHPEQHVRNIHPYVYRMITNACIDRQRREGRWEMSPLETVPEDGKRIVGSRESELIMQEDFNRINILLRSIPQEQSEVLRFRFVDGMTFREIADILEIPVTTIKSRFKYGIGKLRLQFREIQEVANEL